MIKWWSKYVSTWQFLSSAFGISSNICYSFKHVLSHWCRSINKLIDLCEWRVRIRCFLCKCFDNLHYLRNIQRIFQKTYVNSKKCWSDMEILIFFQHTLYEIVTPQKVDILRVIDILNICNRIKLDNFLSSRKCFFPLKFFMRNLIVRSTSMSKNYNLRIQLLCTKEVISTINLHFVAQKRPRFDF